MSEIRATNPPPDDIEELIANPDRTAEILAWLKPGDVEFAREQEECLDDVASTRRLLSLSTEAAQRFARLRPHVAAYCAYFHSTEVRPRDHGGLSDLAYHLQREVLHLQLLLVDVAREIAYDDAYLTANLDVDSDIPIPAEFAAAGVNAISRLPFWLEDGDPSHTALYRGVRDLVERAVRRGCDLDTFLNALSIDLNRLRPVEEDQLERPPTDEPA